MIVLDASVLTSVLVDDDTAAAELAIEWMRNDSHWVVPEHAMIETVHALRGWALAGKIDRAGLHGAVQTLVDWSLDVWPTAPLLPRVLELSHNTTAYDAAYIALAEELSTSLVTLDRRLAAVPGIRCVVRVPGDEPATTTRA